MNFVKLEQRVVDLSDFPADRYKIPKIQKDIANTVNDFLDIALVLKNKDITGWLSCEKSGYFNVLFVPLYRKQIVNLDGRMVGIFIRDPLVSVKDFGNRILAADGLISDKCDQAKNKSSNSQNLDKQVDIHYENIYMSVIKEIEILLALMKSLNIFDSGNHICGPDSITYIKAMREIRKWAAEMYSRDIANMQQISS